MRVETLSAVVETVLPWLEDDSQDAEAVGRRQGAVETIATLADTLGIDIVPYIVLMVVPVLGRMSDMDGQVRIMMMMILVMMMMMTR